MWICDTNIISEVMKRSPDPRVDRWLRELTRIALSVVTVEEIHYGLEVKGFEAQKVWFEKFRMAKCEVLAIDDAIARRAGELRAGMRRSGQVRTQADMFIAATAALHGLPLATRNVRDFERCGVAVMNPFEA